MASGAAGDPEARDMMGGGVGIRSDTARNEARGADGGVRQAENELPQPQPPVLFGFLNVKPEPCIDDT